eukprot:jgi/Tetstr1/461932/TSEL_007010.t1
MPALRRSMLDMPASVETDADLFAAMLVGTADTVVALVEDAERRAEYLLRRSEIEAERRASAERAVVDNMKEAYVSVFEPSQLGVGTSAGDFVLIHGFCLVAEKLGPRAVIFHTDLRNAHNEAWRCTIIQRYIDCSP